MPSNQSFPYFSPKLNHKLINAMENTEWNSFNVCIMSSDTLKTVTYLLSDPFPEGSGHPCANNK